MVNLPKVSQAIALWLFRNDPEVLHSSADICATADGDRFIISNLNEATVELIGNESLLSRTRTTIRRKYPGIQSLCLVTREGENYSFDLYPLAVRQVNPTHQQRSLTISPKMSEILDLPSSTGIVSIKTDQIIAGSELFAKQIGFLNPLGPWGLNVRSTWFAHEYERVHRQLAALPLDTPLGSEANPYEYKARSLADKVRLVNEEGLTEWEAVEAAKHLHIAAIFHRSMIGGEPCRVSTVIDIQAVANTGG